MRFAFGIKILHRVAGSFGVVGEVFSDVFFTIIDWSRLSGKHHAVVALLSIGFVGDLPAVVFIRYEGSDHQPFAGGFLYDERKNQVCFGDALLGGYPCHLDAREDVGIGDSAGSRFLAGHVQRFSDVQGNDTVFGICEIINIAHEGKEVFRPQEDAKQGEIKKREGLSSEVRPAA